MSWCPDCGYYPVVDRSANDGKSWADNLPDVPQETDDNRTALQSIPAWFWAMLGGIIAIAVFSATIRLTYPSDDGPRGTFALVQLLLGFFSMLFAHIIASKYAMKNDRRMNSNDVLLSWFNVWQPTITALPYTCKRIWAFVWGGIAMMTAVTIIGGIDYSAPFRTHEAPKLKPPSVLKTVANAAKAGANKNASMEEALKELGNTEDKLEGLKDLGAERLLNGEESAARRMIECFIYGVVTDDKNIPVSFLYGANTQGQDQHVAEIEAKDLPRDKLRIIAVRLFKEVQKKPYIPAERKAVWVAPSIRCRLSFVAYAENGELTEPKFDALVVNQRGRFDTSQSDSQKQYQRR